MTGKGQKMAKLFTSNREIHQGAISMAFLETEFVLFCAPDLITFLIS